jgi:hypothetical protein
MTVHGDAVGYCMTNGVIDVLSKERSAGREILRSGNDDLVVGWVGFGLQHACPELSGLVDCLVGGQIPDRLHLVPDAAPLVACFVGSGSVIRSVSSTLLPR